MDLVKDEILENLQVVQLRNGLPQTKTLKDSNYDFDIKIETGKHIIIVMGRINALESMILGTFKKYNSCID